MQPHTCPRSLGTMLSVSWSQLDSCSGNVFNEGMFYYLAACWMNQGFEDARPEYIVPTVTFGRGGRMVWSCFVVCYSIQCQKFGEDSFLFQQDNSPVHKVMSMKAKFDEFGMEDLQWFKQSPDL